jgi:hypothetical protein
MKTARVNTKRLDASAGSAKRSGAITQRPRRRVFTLVLALALGHGGDAIAFPLGTPVVVGVGPRGSYNATLATDRRTSTVGVAVRARALMFGAEASLDYHNEDRPGDVDLKSWPIGVSALVFPAGSFYALAGITWAHTTIDLPRTFLIGDDTETEMGYHVGAGVEVPLALVRFAGDVRWSFLDYAFEGLPHEVGAIDADSFRITIAALF